MKMYDDGRAVLRRRMLGHRKIEPKLEQQSPTNSYISPFSNTICKVYFIPKHNLMSQASNKNSYISSFHMRL